MEELTSKQRAELEREMLRITWYHTIDLGNGLVTPGQYDHRELLKHYGLPDDLAGKTVLDVGPASGFFAIEFEKRGAARVATVELPRWSDHDGSPQLHASFERNQLDVKYEAYLHSALEFAIQARNSKV
jgi:tRNA (mo5U34)-methyltransferase